jgi:hypothetical protein
VLQHQVQKFFLLLSHLYSFGARVKNIKSNERRLRKEEVKDW